MGNKLSGLHIFGRNALVQRARKIMVRNMVGKNAKQLTFFGEFDEHSHRGWSFGGKRHEVKHHLKKLVVPSG